MVSSFTLDLTVVIKNRTLGDLCVPVESASICFDKDGKPIKNKDIVIIKREQDTRTGFGTSISFKSIKYKHRRRYKITSYVVIKALDNFKSAKVYVSGVDKLSLSVKCAKESKQ